MAMRSEPGQDRYDVVVVGSGLGGVSAAALLARSGRKVLVVERQDGPGGNAHAFRRGAYTFDPALHWTAQGGPGELYDVLLRHVGARDECTFLPVHSAYDVNYPGFTMSAPLGLEPFIEEHIRQFPHEAAGVRRFFELCNQLHYEIHQLSMSLSLRKLDDAAATYPTLFKFLRLTLREALDECMTDPRAKAVCAASWPYVGAVPGRVGMLPFGQTLANQLEGNWYCQGGFQKFADALVVGVEKHDGELVVSNGARQILVEDGRVTGVVLEGGQRVAAPVVVSNADALHTFETLIGPDHLPAPFMRRLRRMTPSFSAFVTFAATSLDVTQHTSAHETFLSGVWDGDGAHEAILRGEPRGVWVNIPTLLDPALAPPGEHLVIISAMASYDIGRPWPEAKAAYEDEMLRLTEQVLPGLRRHLTFVESATPLTLERYTLSHRGAAYGWENTPNQTGTKRLSHQTPITGLYVSGHWSLPGTASTRVISSGIHTAQIVLSDTGGGAALPAFGDANLPSVS